MPEGWSGMDGEPEQSLVERLEGHAEALENGPYTSIKTAREAFREAADYIQSLERRVARAKHEAGQRKAIMEEQEKTIDGLVEQLDSLTAALGEKDKALRLFDCIDWDNFTEHDELLLETVKKDVAKLRGTEAALTAP